MKKMVIWLCALMLCCTPALAAPLSAEDAMAIVESYLTEVYNYTAEEADTFTAAAVWEEDHWRINFASAAHPEWIYTATYTDHAALPENVETPFWKHGGYANYPGEGAVREGLNRAKKNNWFTVWDLSAQNALQQYMAEWGITATARLTEGLSLGTISASDALYEYFLSCYGDEAGWTVELRQWYEAEVAALGLTPGQAETIDLSPGITAYEAAAYNGQTVDVVRFIGEIPEDLQPVFRHPKLEGWSCLCGATATNQKNGFGFGLAAFEKDGTRLLVALRRESEAEDWRISPVSQTALHTDRSFAILPDSDSVHRWFIVYPGSPTERFGVSIASMDDGRLDAAITSYTRMDEATDDGFQMVIDGEVRAVAYENHQKAGSGEYPESFPTMMSRVDISVFPTSMDGLKAAEAQLIPEGYGLVSGVHLRKSTSSRSKDLGDYKPGVLVKLLGVEPGDPDPWYRVQAGRAEGYMSSRYVDRSIDVDTGYVLNRPLPVAKALKEIKLKKDAGVLSGSITSLPAGTMMHVLAECDGGWLHVSVPKGPIGWQMDVNGTDGYVKADDVLMAGNELALSWLE